MKLILPIFLLLMMSSQLAMANKGIEKLINQQCMSCHGNDLDQDNPNAKILFLDALNYNSCSELQSQLQDIMTEKEIHVRIPKEELKNNTITPNSEGFNRDHSSVEGVFAPWQNPMNSRSSQLVSYSDLPIRAAFSESYHQVDSTGNA